MELVTTLDVEPFTTASSAEVYKPTEHRITKKTDAPELKSTIAKLIETTKEYIKKSKESLYLQDTRKLLVVTATVSAAMGALVASCYYSFYGYSSNSNDNLQSPVPNNPTPSVTPNGYFINRYEGEKYIDDIKTSPEIAAQFELLADVIRQGVNKAAEKLNGFCISFGEIICEAITRIKDPLIYSTLKGELHQDEKKEFFINKLFNTITDLVNNINKTEQPGSLLEDRLDAASPEESELADLFTPMDFKYFGAYKFPNIMYCMQTISGTLFSAFRCFGIFIPPDLIVNTFFYQSLDPLIAEHDQGSSCLY